MKYAIVCSKLNGNTGMLFNKIKETLNSEDCIYAGLPNDEALKADLIYIGFWTNMGTCDPVINKFIQTLTNQKVFLFGSCGFGLSEEYFTKIIDSVKDKLPTGVSVIDSYMCVGKMPQSVKDRYLAMKEKDPTNKKIDMLIENFDLALSHPDSLDIENLVNKLKK